MGLRPSKFKNLCDLFFFFFLKRENSLIHKSMTLYLNEKIKVLKILKDDITFKYIVRINDLKVIQLIILRYLEYLKF